MAFLGAALAVALVVLSSGSVPDANPADQGGDWSRRLDSPQKVHAKLASGKVISGQLESFTSDEFAGDFGTARWIDLPAKDLHSIYSGAMDKKDAAQWMNLGRLLLVVPDGDKRAETAFRKAVSLDRALKDQVEAVRLRATDERRQADQERLQSVLPDGGVAPWPVLSTEEQEAALATMKLEGERICREAGVQAQLLETRYFLLYTDLPADESSRWASQLDRMYARLADKNLLGLPSGLNLFWGKAVVLIFRTRDRFEAVERAAFQNQVADGVVGLCHMIGPQVIVNMERPADEMQFAAVLVHETVHGILHRCLTQRRLPAWADEGLCEWVAATSFPNSPVNAMRRPQALRFIREGGGVGPVLELSYERGTWPGPNAIGYAIGFVLTDLMIRQRGEKFWQWVRAVKSGKEWRTALEEDFGVKVEALASGAEAYFMTND